MDDTHDPHVSLRLRRLAEAVLKLDPKDEGFVAEVGRIQVIARGYLDKIDLGGSRLVNIKKARETAGKNRREAYLDRVRMLQPIIKELRAAGRNSLPQIAEALDARGIKPVKGERWSISTVRKIENEVLPEVETKGE
jgi:hypothetical protein